MVFCNCNILWIAFFGQACIIFVYNTNKRQSEKVENIAFLWMFFVADKSGCFSNDVYSCKWQSANAISRNNSYYFGSVYVWNIDTCDYRQYRTFKKIQPDVFLHQNNQSGFGKRIACHSYKHNVVNFWQ